MLKILTDTGFIAFDDLMIIQLEDIVGNRRHFPWDSTYDEARAVWNGMINHYPAVIVDCESTVEIVQVVQFCKEYNIKISVRGGGHHVTGSAVITDTLVINMTAMNQVIVDENSRNVEVEAGATWGEVDETTQQYGLAIPAGLVSDTGVAGLTLGGGYGWLRRKYGLSSDNIKAVEMVTGDGQIRWIDENNPEIFWAIRGGGGHMGIITRFIFTAHPIGKELYMTSVFIHASKPSELISQYVDKVKDLEAEISSMLVLGRIPEDDIFAEKYHDEPYIAIFAVYIGNPTIGETKMERFKQSGNIIADFSGTRKYTEIQTFFDDDYPSGGRYYWSWW